jgi:hypothetical protein
MVKVLSSSDTVPGSWDGRGGTNISPSIILLTLPALFLCSALSEPSYHFVI